MLFMRQCCSWDNAVHGTKLFMGQCCSSSWGNTVGALSNAVHGAMLLAQCCSWGNVVGAMMFTGQRCRGNVVGQCCWELGHRTMLFNGGRSLYLPGLTLTRWLPSHEAPLDSRLSTKSSAWQGVRRTRYVQKTLQSYGLVDRR